MKWNTEKRKVSDLKAYDNNPRQITDAMFEKLKQSIDNIGYVELIAIDTDNTIVAGHMRVKALVALGRGEEIVEVRVPERRLTKEEFEKYLIVSNKVTGAWDYNKLANSFDNEFLFDAGFEAFELGMSNDDSEKDFSEGNKEIDIKDVREELSETCPKCGFEFSNSEKA